MNPEYRVKDSEIAAVSARLVVCRLLRNERCYTSLRAQRSNLLIRFVHPEYRVKDVEIAAVAAGLVVCQLLCNGHQPPRVSRYTKG